VTGLAFFRGQSFLEVFQFLSNWGHFTAKKQSFSSLVLFAKDRKAGVFAVFF
jgi:hypothetical protein